MTDDELKDTQTAIVTLETEIAGLTTIQQDCIERARDFNSRGREAAGKRTSLQVSLDKARKMVGDELNARAVEAKRIFNEAAAARAEAAKKAAEEAAAAKAAEPPQPTELELLRMEVAALRDELKK